MALTTHGSGESFPLKSFPEIYDVVCVPPSFDTTCWMENIEFINWK